MTGWRPLITTTCRLAHQKGASLRRRPIKGRLLLERVGDATDEPADYVRGVLTGAWALSAEICELCGGPGDPVTLERGHRGTRCAGCRKPGDQTVSRPPWRRERDRNDDAFGPLLEDIIGIDDLATLMEARHPPATHRGWPARRAKGDSQRAALIGPAGSGKTGWNHLLRACFSILLPLECPGIQPPWRLGQVKERLGHLTVYHARRYTPFYDGLSDIVSHFSGRTCIECGQPGRLRNTRWGWVHPACDACRSIELLKLRGFLRRSPRSS